MCANASGLGTLQGLNSIGPVNQFTDLILANGNTRNAQNVLAAEQFCHLVEGWRYASEAVTAFLKHSRGTALHLAYYAELRAAISLFSWSGIRMLQGDYYYLDARGAKNSVSSQRTHSAAWEIWKHWIHRPDALNLLNDEIQLLSGVTLGHVLAGVQWRTTPTTVQQWGLDLPRVADDHSARNKSSYRAYWVDTPLTTMPATDKELILDLWRLMLSESSSALKFDSALIRYFVNQSLPAMALPVQGTQDEKRAAAIQNICTSVSANTGIPVESIKARLDVPSTDLRPFDLAASASAEAENVLCRSFVLLRLASLAAKRSISLTTNASARTWLTNWLIHAGVWLPNSGIALTDVEDDYRVAVDQIAPGPVLPQEIWVAPNVTYTAKIVRPDACLAWCC
jgi:hypothetical protein